MIFLTFKQEPGVDKTVLKQEKSKFWCSLNRESNISAHVLLNLLNTLRKRDKMRGMLRKNLNNSIIQEHECKLLFIN